MASKLQIPIEMQVTWKNLKGDLQNYLADNSKIVNSKKNINQNKKNALDALTSNIQGKINNWDSLDIKSVKELQKNLKDYFNLLTEIVGNSKDIEAINQKYAAQIASLEKERKGYEKTLSSLRKQGIIKNNKTGVVGYSLKAAEEQWSQAGIANAKGKIVKFNTAKENFSNANYWGNNWSKVTDWVDKYNTNTNQKREEYTTASKGIIRVDEAIIDAEKAKLNEIKSQPLSETDKQQLTNFSSQEASLSSKISQVLDYEPGTNENPVDNIELLNTKIQAQQSVLGKAFKQLTVYAIALRAVKNAMREGVQTIKELDKSLTEQAMVTGMTRDQAYQLVDSYQAIATQVGATTKEIAEVATEYMKQGQTIADSLTLTEAAVAAAKVARVSVGDSVNYLTTALNGYGMSAEEAMSVSDKFAAVAAASATDYDELAIALSKVASQANLAGMSMDYTIALLTKGLETTREAPETMGTALKTIIARMRELSDYGSTLEGDTDINNVESQLAYVGIALRDANGELRSTEDVLDELGRKWDTLNTNQQAALAKALAGTRQQSRLIALMDNYERTIELQQIAARSTGATTAQAATYLEGMEGSLNNITVAWEKFVTTLTNSDVVLTILDGVADFLEGINTLFNTWIGQVAIFGTIGVFITNLIAKKVVENNLAKEQAELVRKQQIAELEKQQAQMVNAELQKNGVKLSDAQLTSYAAEYKSLQAVNKQLSLQNRLKAGKNVSTKEISTAGVKEIQQANAAREQSVSILQQYDAAYTKLSKTNTLFQNNQKQINYLQSQSNILGSSSLIVMAAQIAIEKIAVLFKQKKAKAKVQSAAASSAETASEVASAAATKADTAATKENTDATKENIAVNQAANASNPAGWIILAVEALIIGTALIGSFVSWIVNAMDKNAQNLKLLKENNVEIYKINEKLTKLETAATSFDALDNKLIKTNEDLKEMDDLLNNVSESLDSTAVDDKTDIGFGKGVNEADYYAQFSTNAGKRLALDYIEEVNNKKLQEIHNKNLKIIAEYSGEIDTLKDTNQQLYTTLQETAYAEANNKLYLSLDKLTDLTAQQSSNLQTLGEQIIENMTGQEAYNATVDGTIQRMTELIASLDKLQVTAADGSTEYMQAYDILTSDDYTLLEQVNAYKQIADALAGTGEAYDAFNTLYNQYQTFASMTDDVLEFIDSMGISIDELNTFYNAWETLQKKGVNITQEEFQSHFEDFLKELAATDGDIQASIMDIYGTYLNQFERGTQEWLDAYNAFLNAYSDMISVGILNMGQNIESLKNSINDVYEKASSWSTMSESDKTTFISDNVDLFSGEQGATLLKAFQSNDYAAIQQALMNNDTLLKKVAERRKEIENELIIEEARVGDARNEAYIQQLKDYLAYLNSGDNLFLASLELRLEQQDKELEEYKTFLQDQQEALEDSLDKRKEAYQDYFDTINQESEDEDYEEQASTLVNNLGKLSTASDAASKKQAKELQNSLEELEEERLDTLRERAQDAIISNIEDTIDQINNKFDQLLDNNQAMLAAMTGQLQSDPTAFVSNLLANKIANGATGLEIQDYLNTLQTTFGNLLGTDFNWDNIQFSQGAANNTILNVEGKEYVLSSDKQQTLFEIINKALTELGIR